MVVIAVERLKSGQILDHLKVEQIGFADRMDVLFEGKKSKIFSLRS